MNMGDFMPSLLMPCFITEKLIVMTPAISIAPQKLISPSPSGSMVSAGPDISVLYVLTGEVQISHTELGAGDVHW